ncbi:3-oxoadipate enol-lactonase [Haloechinothrix alba]|uniref:3-oxoadipate enol-lactonase n=1 Tax=Haloechinothrix alba TaxID=664784 RepID=A0A238WTS1_9PSEU|nr:3-oxoadipate enol-lactonase [Haloechinothrix alba]SNR49029.1 3-oxoadipate enol-lactonase [Haloechinothrix alba]
MSVELYQETAVPAAGDGAPTVVLSGSLGSDRTMWTPQVPALLGAGYRVVRYDHRGHGLSPVPDGPYDMADLGADAVALLDALGCRQVHWVGLSLGGMVGMWLAQHAPDRVASLALCCTSAALDPQPWSERARLVREHGTRAVSEAVVGRWLTPGCATAHPETVERLRRMVEATPDEGYASCCAAIGGMDIAGGLQAVSVPTLVIAGEQDVATPPEHGRWIAESVPGARMEVLDPAAHLANVERPEEMNRLLLDHLKELR